MFNGGGLLARSSHVGLELNLLAFVRVYRGRERGREIEGENERERTRGRQRAVSLPRGCILVLGDDPRFLWSTSGLRSL